MSASILANLRAAIRQRLHVVRAFAASIDPHAAGLRALGGPVYPDGLSGDVEAALDATRERLIASGIVERHEASEDAKEGT